MSRRLERNKKWARQERPSSPPHREQRRLPISNQDSRRLALRSWRSPPRFQAAFIALRPREHQKSCGPREKKWCIPWGSMPMGDCWPEPETVDRSCRLTAAASTRNWRRRVPHRLRGSLGLMAARCTSARPIRERYFRSGRNLRPRARLSRSLLTPSCSPSGAESSGGGCPQVAGRQKEPKHPYVEFYVRSGNTEDPGKEWSEWFGPYATPNTQVEAPAARFLQWKAVIHDGRTDNGIDWVSVAYLPKNVAPVIDGIAVQESGVRAQADERAAEAASNASAHASRNSDIDDNGSQI